MRNNRTASRRTYANGRAAAVRRRADVSDDLVEVEKPAMPEDGDFPEPLKYARRSANKKAKRGAGIRIAKGCGLENGWGVEFDRCGGNEFCFTSIAPDGYKKEHGPFPIYGAEGMLMCVENALGFTTAGTYDEKKLIEAYEKTVGAVSARRSANRRVPRKSLCAKVSMRRTAGTGNIDAIDEIVRMVEQGAPYSSVDEVMDAIEFEIERSLTYTDDIFDIAQSYISDGDLVNMFYEDFYNDVYRNVDAESMVGRSARRAGRNPRAAKSAMRRGFAG